MKRKRKKNSVIMIMTSLIKSSHTLHPQGAQGMKEADVSKEWMYNGSVEADVDVSIFFRPRSPEVWGSTEWNPWLAMKLRPQSLSRMQCIAVHLTLPLLCVSCFA